jgi:quercetin dioxygenase-like cupin family protein
LEVPISALFDEQEPSNGTIVRKHQRKRLKVPQSSIFYELLTPDLNRQLELIWIEVEPGQKNIPEPTFGHVGEESAVVLCGQVHVQIKDQIYILNEGDSISFDSSEPHNIANLGSEKVVMVSAITPPSF